MRMVRLIESGRGILIGANLLFGVMILLFTLSSLSGAESLEEEDLALERYYTANGLYNRQLYELAAREYSDFLETYPGHEKTLRVSLGLALSRFGMGNYDEAEPLLKELSSLVQGAERIQIHLVWGQTLLTLDRASEAAKAFEGGLSGSDSGNRESLLAGLVEAHYQDSDWPNVVKWSRVLADLAPSGGNTWRASFQGAKALFELKRFEQATEALQSLLQGSEGASLEQQVVFLLAESQREREDLNGAAQSYARAQEIGGTFTADSLFRLGYIRFHQGRFGDAIKPFRTLLRDHGDHPSVKQAAILFGRAYLEEENYRQAEAIFRKFAEFPEMEAEATLWQGKGLMRQERYAEVERLLARVAQKESRFQADLLYDYGSALLRQQKFDQAAAAYVAMVDKYSSNLMASEATRLGALCLHRAGDYQASLVQCERFLAREKIAQEKSEAVDEIAFLKGENYFFLEEADEAIKAYREFLAQYDESEESASARMRLGMIYHSLEMWQEAVSEFQELDGASGTLFSQAKFLLGDAFFELGQWDRAIASFEDFAENEPTETNADTALFKAAQAYERKQNVIPAIDSLKRLVGDFSESRHLAHALVELGRLQYESQQLAEARKSLGRVVRQHADDSIRPQADYYLGWIALSEEKRADAIQHFARVVSAGKAHPLAADASLQRGLLLVETEAFSEGKRALDEFADTYASEARLDQALFYSGIASVGEKNWDDALRRFQLVVDQHSDSVLRERALYESAWAEKNAGRNARAMVHYETLLTNFPNTKLAQSAVFELAELEYDAEEFASVRQRLTKLLPALAEGALRARVQFRLGWAYLSEGQLLDAAKSFESMLGDAPPESLVAMAAFQAGEARLKLREYAAAGGHFALALGADKNDEIVERILLRLGETQALLGQWNESEQTYARLVSEFPKSPLVRRAQFGVGWSLENREDYNDAISFYRKVLVGGKRDETSARCQFQIGECLLAEKRFDEAIREFIQLEVNYGYPEWSAKALLEIGRALEEKGDLEGASGRYSEVLSKYPETTAAEVAKDFAENLSDSEN